MGSISNVSRSSLTRSMRYPILPACAFIGVFLALITAFWNWRAGRTPTLSLIAWLFTMNVAYGANNLVWSDDVQDRAPIWCDICEYIVLRRRVLYLIPFRTATKLIIGASMALPACNLCISKHLAMIGAGRAARLDHRDRRRIVMFDLGFCWGVPAIFMALRKSPVVYFSIMAEELTHLPDYIVQGHRYDVIQYIGCLPTTYMSIPGIFIVYIPPLLLSLGSSVYAGTCFRRPFAAPTSDILSGIALYHFVRMRRTLSSILQAASTSMSANQYKRLMAMSVSLMIWSTILTTFFVWANILRGVRPWVSWEYVHFGWYRVRLWPWVLMDPLSRALALMTYWAVPLSTLISFIFLGFGEDALKGYKKIGSAIASKFQSKALLLKRNERSGKEKSQAPPFILPGLRFALLPTIQSSPAYPSQRSPDEPSTDTPPPENTSATNQEAQELPQIQPLRSLYSMIGPPRLKTQSRSSGKSYEWRWSARSEKPRAASLELDGAERGLHDCVSGTRTATIAEPHELLTGEAVQEAVQEEGQGGEPHDQV